MNEKTHSPEKKEIEDREVIDVLISKGNEDPEAHEFLLRWTEQEEQKVGPTPEDAIEFNRRQARLYLAAGYIVDALDTLNGAAMRAWNEQRDELCAEIMTEIRKIEGR